jgi:hypothetical protein
MKDHVLENGEKETAHKWLKGFIGAAALSQTGIFLTGLPASGGINTIDRMDHFNPQNINDTQIGV